MRGQCRFMDKQCFHAVASCWVAKFAIQDDTDTRLNIGVWVDVDSTETVCVSKYRDARVGFDVANQIVRTARNDKINVVIAFQKRSNNIPNGYQLNGRIRYGGCRKGGRDGGGNGKERCC